MGRITIPVVAGAFIRGQLRRELKWYCIARGYQIAIDEDKGLFESLLTVTIDVPDIEANQANRDLMKVFKRFQELTTQDTQSN